MTDIEKAKAAYIKAFKEHPLNKLRKSLPADDIAKKIGDALNNSKEWMDYQNAWIAVHGVKPIFSYDWDVDVKTRQRSFIESMYARKPRKSKDVDPSIIHEERLS